MKSSKIGRNIERKFDFSATTHNLKIVTSYFSGLQLNGRRVGESPFDDDVREGDSIEVVAQAMPQRACRLCHSHENAGKIYSASDLDRKAFVDASR